VSLAASFELQASSKQPNIELNKNFKLAACSLELKAKK
jgi:hypothetical protein